jgi:hypothetical protein
MNALTTFVKRQIVGSTFTLTPTDLEISSEAFHALATGLAIEGGGDGFEVVKMYSESQSGFRRVHRVMCQRVPMVDGS